VPIVLKFWSLTLLETSGPVQACNGIALPYYYYNYDRTTTQLRMGNSKKGADEAQWYTRLTLKSPN